MFRLFRKKPFKKIINHEDWLLIDGEPAIVISKKEHKRSNLSIFDIRLQSPDGISKFSILDDGSVLIQRGIPIYIGTCFRVTITIE